MQFLDVCGKKNVKYRLERVFLLEEDVYQGNEAAIEELFITARENFIERSTAIRSLKRLASKGYRRAYLKLQDLANLGHKEAKDAIDYLKDKGNSFPQVEPDDLDPLLQSSLGQNSPVVSSALKTGEIKEKLNNLGRFWSDAAPEILQFAEFLSVYYLPTNGDITPEAFAIAARLAVNDLQTGINGLTRRPVSSELVGRPAETYTLLSESVPAIAKAVAPEDFANKVEIYLESQFPEDRTEQISSSVAVNDTFGGIDFTAFPIVTRAVNNLSIASSGVSFNKLSAVNLNQQWRQIEQMGSSGIIFSSQKVSEYLQASCCQDAIIDSDKVSSTIAERLRQEEEDGLPADTLLIDILAVLQSVNSQAQLKAVLLGH